MCVYLKNTWMADQTETYYIRDIFQTKNIIKSLGFYRKKRNK